jgi:hypothetical protein
MFTIRGKGLEKKEKKPARNDENSRPNVAVFVRNVHMLQETRGWFGAKVTTRNAAD